MLGYLALGALTLAAVSQKPQPRPLGANRTSYRGGVVTMLPGTRIAAQASYKGLTSPVLYEVWPSKNSDRVHVAASVRAARWIDARIAAEEARNGTVELTDSRHDVALGHSPVRPIPRRFATALPTRQAGILVTEEPVALAAAPVTQSL